MALIEAVNKLEWRRIPLLGQEGWPRHQTLEGRGRGGHSGRTIPSALSKVASQLFVDAQPPLLSQEGNTPDSTFVHAFIDRRRSKTRFWVGLAVCLVMAAPAFSQEPVD